VPLDYDSDYAPEDISFRFRMEWENVPQTAGGVWRVLSRGSDAGTGMEESDAAGYGIAYEEEYDGYAPECWLAHCQGDNYIFLKAPAGDTSQKTYFYRVSSQGIILIGSMDIAMNRETPLDPDAMWMNTNQVISKEPLQLMAVGIYTLGDDGFPSHPRKVHRLVGKEVVLKGDQRLNPSRREDAAVSGGMWNLAGGTVLYPYRSDLKSWIDFRTEDGRICRFAINEFSDQVVLDRFRLEDLFE
ncbi:MAG: hypothetical protein IJV04_08460, partial [Lachnospiraceae bacterium]|nr:hypothetical protein [Lachnospiraceae bacterium]